MLKPKLGRPLTWMTKIDAPPEAQAFYEMLAAMQHSRAFKTCHIYKGSVDKKTGIPMLRFEGRVHSMPYVISSFMGIEYGRRNCQTPGCVNPFHYAPPDRPVQQVKMDEAIAPPATGDDWNDLIDYYVEEQGVKLNYLALRAAIPEEDINEFALRTAIENYGKRQVAEPEPPLTPGFDPTGQK